MLLVTVTVSISVLVWQDSGLRDPAMLAYPAILAFASTMGGRRLFFSLLAMILLVVAVVGMKSRRIPTATSETGARPGSVVRPPCQEEGKSQARRGSLMQSDGALANAPAVARYYPAVAFLRPFR